MMGMRGRGGLWSAGAVAIAAVVLAPVAAVLALALVPTGDLWLHLWSTALPRYLGTTLALMVAVGGMAAVAGTGAAWLVTMFRFPGARWLEMALLFPLAIPAYVGAYAVVDFLDYSGAVQTALRTAMGWASSRDYWFPEVRSFGAAAVVLAAALYPYVYLMARAAFREQSGCTHDVARALGATPWRLFWRVGLPMARPAVAAGVALVLMETVADYGTVNHFGVQTLTTGIFTVWLSGNDQAGAAQLALVALGLVLVLLGLERAGRRGARFHRVGTVRPVGLPRLAGWQGAAAFLFCFLPFATGFLLPLGVMLDHGLRNPQAWVAPGLGRALFHTLAVGGAAAALTVAAALFMVYGVRLSGARLPRLLLPLTTLGYAAPGAVLAVGFLVPLAALDHRVADAVLALTGRDPGLLLTGTAGALVLAYMVRFFAVAQGAAEAAFGRVTPALPAAARSLGRGPGGALAAVYLPLMRGSVATALLIVFVDCVKELPATLLLRPFNFDTLATRTYELASLERLGEASPAALVVMAVGLAAVAVMARTAARPV